MIDCENCRDGYSVHQECVNEHPVIVFRDEVDKKKRIRKQYAAIVEAISKSKQAERLRSKIIAAIDDEKSMAARLRKLREFRLTFESYATYRKRPYDGAEAVSRAGGATLARIGSTMELGAGDQEYFARRLAELEQLDLVESSIKLKVVKLGGKEVRFGADVRIES